VTRTKSLTTKERDGTCMFAVAVPGLAAAVAVVVAVADVKTLE